MPRILQNLGDSVISMLNAGMAMNVVAMYIRNTHLRNRFETATATAANTDGTQNNRISIQTVRKRLREGDLSARRPYVGCVLARRQRLNRINWAHTHQRWLRQQ